MPPTPIRVSYNLLPGKGWRADAPEISFSRCDRSLSVLRDAVAESIPRESGEEACAELEESYHLPPDAAAALEQLDAEHTVLQEQTTALEKRKQAVRRILLGLGVFSEDCQHVSQALSRSPLVRIRHPRSRALTDWQTPPCENSAIYDIMLLDLVNDTIRYVVHEGLFEHAAEDGATKDDVIRRFAWGPFAVEIILGICVAKGLLRRDGDRYVLTDLTRTYLLDSSPFYFGHMLVPKASEDPNFIRGCLRQEPVRKHHADEWEQGKASDDIESLQSGMHAQSFAASTGLARHVGFESISSVLDIAGGSGGVLISIMKMHSHVRGGLFELPGMNDVARRNFRRYGLEDRVGFYNGDMFRDPWPDGFDCALFSNIFHDWPPDVCIDLARRAYGALPSGGTILLQEMLLEDDKEGPLIVLAYSMLMLFSMKGRQYSGSEIRRFLEEAGFHDVSYARTFGYFSTITARKP